MRLEEKYTKEIKAPALMQKYNYKSVMQIPKLDKVVINMGVGDARENSKAVESAVMTIWRLITGQKPVIYKGIVSLSQHSSVREGMNIGCKVTLRGSQNV